MSKIKLSLLAVALLLGLLPSFRSQAKTKIVPVYGTTTVSLVNRDTKGVKWNAPKGLKLKKLSCASRKVRSNKAGKYRVTAKLGGKKQKLDYDTIQFVDKKKFGRLSNNWVVVDSKDETYTIKWNTSKKINPDEVEWSIEGENICGVYDKQVSEDGKSITFKWDGSSSTQTLFKIVYCGVKIDYGFISSDTMNKQSQR